MCFIYRGHSFKIYFTFWVIFSSASINIYFLYFLHLNCAHLFKSKKKKSKSFILLPETKCVVYWPTTRLGCQNRKCTCVNNRCIQSRNIRIITLTVDRLNECEIVMPTRRRWASNYHITQCTGNSISLETRPVGDKMW